MTIPHNGNRSWGYAFANHTIDNDKYTIDDWKLRNDNEPLVEIFQDKIKDHKCLIPNSNIKKIGILFKKIEKND